MKPKPLEVSENVMIGISLCCNRPTMTMPSIMGEPAITFCTACTTECERVWKPKYEKIAKGHYRLIKYTTKSLQQ